MSSINQLRAELLGMQALTAALSAAEAENHARTLRDESAPESEAKAAYRYVAEELEQAVQHIANAKRRLGL